jgi:ribosomal protein S18 acetylase RimI-like enzyme
MAFGVLADDEVTADLYGMWVHPEERRRGAGHALVLAIAEWASSNSRRTIRLDVANGNIPAFRLYESMGFRASGVSQPLPSNPTISELEMLLSL